MRRQVQDVATNLPGMTNREDLPDSVAVPVELLKELIEIVSFHKGSTPAGRQATALIPKPKPRLVVVDLLDGHNRWFKVDLESQPDLLALLDQEIEEVGWRMYGIDPAAVTAMKFRIRNALGVTE